jgi:hypothetical protein
LAAGVVAAAAAAFFFLWCFFLAFAGAAAGAAAAGAAVVVVCAKTKLEVEATNKATKAIANNFFMIILLLIWADQKTDSVLPRILDGGSLKKVAILVKLLKTLKKQRFLVLNIHSMVY